MASLADRGILTEETARDMTNAARCRNVLIHADGDVVDHDVVSVTAHDLDRYR